MTESPLRPKRFRRLLRLSAIVVAALVAYVAWTLGPPFAKSWWSGLPPNSRRKIAVGFLDGCLVAYGVALSGSLLGGAWSIARIIQGRRRRARRPRSARFLLFCLANLSALGILEIAAWGLAAYSRIPPNPPSIPPLVPSATSGESTLTLLVLGESSAEGQPFQPWFSIGQIIAWQLERARPGRKVEVMMRASGGTDLESSVALLESVPRRPDIVLLCSGHNEFQARWGWAHTVNYYPEDRAERPRDTLADRVGGPTPFTRLILDAVEHQAIDQPPPVSNKRRVVDRPICDSATRRRIHRDFAAQVATVVSWCERSGAVPILVIPAGNDVGFDPARSVLDPETRSADRELFARDFLAAKAIPDEDPDAAIAAYRGLIARQPIFAEAHYRLAQRLQARGDVDEAREHYTLARDHDGLPMRCPSDYQDVYRAIAATHPAVVLIDGPNRLPLISPTKLLDDNLFHDGQHPSYRAYLALAQDALDELRDRDLFALREAALPPVDPAECAIHFGLNTNARWAEVCRRAASFWGRVASTRHDSRERRSRFERLTRAAEAIERGVAPEDSGIPGLGINPRGFPASTPPVRARPGAE